MRNSVVAEDGDVLFMCCSSCVASHDQTTANSDRRQIEIDGANQSTK
jgi:hypothetical protein